MESQQCANVDESNILRTIKLFLLCAWSSASFHLQGGRYLLSEAAAVLSQPGSFYRHVWRKVAFK